MERVCYVYFMPGRECRWLLANFIECVLLDGDLCRVALEFPKIEVRFQNLTVETYVHVGSRALPTIPNFICNMTEVLSSLLFFSFRFLALIWIVLCIFCFLACFGCSSNVLSNISF